MTRPAVLITGGDGYVGQRVARQLLERHDLDVVLAVRASCSRTVDEKILQLNATIELAPSRVVVVAADLRDPSPFSRLGAELRQRLTTIVHAAAVTRFNVEQEVAQAVNVDGTKKVLDLATTCPNLQSFVQVSSLYATGLQSGAILEEPAGDEIGTANWYEWSKREAEHVVAAAGLPCPHSVARLATVVADDRSGRVGQYNAFHNTLKLCFYGLLSLLPGDAATPLYFVTGDFAARAVAALAVGREHGTFHVAPPVDATLTLAEAIDVAFGVFENDEDFRRRGVLPPLLADEESFAMLAGEVGTFSGEVVGQAMATIAPFARQLYVSKRVDTARLDAVLGRPSPLDPKDLVERVARHLVATRWGRRAG